MLAPPLHYISQGWERKLVKLRLLRFCQRRRSFERPVIKPSFAKTEKPLFQIFKYFRSCFRIAGGFGSFFLVVRFLLSLWKLKHPSSNQFFNHSQALSSSTKFHMLAAPIEMCLLHIYRPSCGHFALLEPQEDEAVIFCENAPCKKPTVEIADLLSRCSQCHADAVQAVAIPKMHQVDVSKFHNRHQRPAEVPKLDKLRAAGLPHDTALTVFRTRVWNRIKGERASSSRQRGRQSLEGFKYRRRTIFEDPVSLGFYDMV
ncbi:hypothetical protein ABW19_dt0206086 [Dactylella cylindrospora]|nr:hypothetical protein ABW19_dt0206086 [Dactylella cylindrospora]